MGRQGSAPAGRAVVTGASRGIGKAVAERLSDDGYDVIGLDVSAGHARACDVSDPVAVEAAAAQAGPVDVLVNNAGIWNVKPFLETSAAEVERVVEVNLIGTMNCTRSFGGRMLERGRGVIINIASIAATAPNPATGAYTPTKAGVVAFTQQIAFEWGPHGIRCNAVSPGMIVTEGASPAYRDEGVVDARSRAIPLQRLGRPGDIAAVVSFLVSEDAAYITGQNIAVDGGLTQSLFAVMPPVHRDP